MPMALIKIAMSATSSSRHHRHAERVFASSSIPCPDVLAGKRVVVIDDSIRAWHHKRKLVQAPGASAGANGGAQCASAHAPVHPSLLLRHRQPDNQMEGKLIAAATTTLEEIRASGGDSLALH